MSVVVDIMRYVIMLRLSSIRKAPLLWLTGVKLSAPERSPESSIFHLSDLQVIYAGSSIVIAIGSVRADRVAPDYAL